ncbi:serine protease [Acinetobacter corruptisaponis]|uniref:Serine protease n=1 Tax=Acinetobacter corruptisaponis TaxID=3045147 RepID=A0ABY8S0J5_9GAMM|nr:serine protease [Acinetobacter sp. KCTC 92772]WHP05128.1 serine protease [Acinetobacter sp. KCTC 92772]
MLSVSEQLAYSTVRIECELKSGGISTGTGFFFNFLEDKVSNTHVPVIITNKHVIKDTLRGRIIITKANQNGEPINTEHFSIILENFESFWRLHPEIDVDLCAMPIAPLINEAQSKNERLFYIPLTKNLLPTEQHREEFTALEDVLMIGYPNGIWDRVNNMPIFRRGITATHPILDYNGKKEIMIDIAAFPGSSGSPVLIFNEGGYMDKKGNMYMGSNRIILLGILYAGPQATTTGEIIMSPNIQRPIAISQIPNNLGLIIKAERIMEMEKLFVS